MDGTEVIGRGWAFPLRLMTKRGTGNEQGPIDQRGDSQRDLAQVSQGRLPKLISGEEKIRQSIWLILSTAPGERQMRPEFGCGIHDLVFQPNTATLRTKIQEKVTDALLRWEPRIDVNAVRVETPSAQVPSSINGKNHLLIRIDYRIRANNTLYNLVYPFFLTEGVG